MHANLLKQTQKPAITIRHDPLRYTMLHHHSSHKQLHTFFNGNHRLASHKANIFRCTIYKHCSCIIIPILDGQVCDDIYHTLIHNVVWSKHRLQESWWLVGRYFGSLKHPIGMNMISTIMIHAFPLVAFCQCMHHAIPPKVPIQRAVMMQTQQSTEQYFTVRFYKCKPITTMQ